MAINAIIKEIDILKKKLNKRNDEPGPLTQWPSTLPLELKDKPESHITRSNVSNRIRMLWIGVRMRMKI